MTSPSSPDDLARLRAEVARLAESGELFFQPHSRDHDDVRTRKQPSASDRLVATFKWEDTSAEGEDVGPLIVFDPDAGEVVWESPDWMRAAEAESLARANRWRFAVDD